MPKLFGLPRWIELEIVLLAWWILWSCAFSVLLYKGWRLARDHRGFAQPGIIKTGMKLIMPNASDCVVDDGFFFVVGAVILAICAALTAVFLLVELIIPFIVTAAYWLLIRGMARVANDSHACRHRLGRAVGWGVVWATMYNAPLALLVWVIRSVVLRG